MFAWYEIAMRKTAAVLLVCAAVATAISCATTSTPSLDTKVPSHYTNQLDHFSDLRVGMTQAEVLKVMGTPPLKAETRKARDGRPFIEWQYCATHEATNTNEFAWLVFKDQALTFMDSRLSHAGIHGQIVDCAAIVKQGYSNAVAASQKAAAEAQARARAEAQAEAERKEVRQRRTAAAAAALNAGAKAMSESLGSESPSSSGTSSTPLLLYADNHQRTFLGCLNCNAYDDVSVFNQYGDYGSKYSDTSIRNQYSDFGSRYSDLSPCSPHASKPPLILDNDGDYYGRLTVNKYADDANVEDSIQRLVRLLCMH